MKSAFGADSIAVKNLRFGEVNAAEKAVFLFGIDFLFELIFHFS
jgi:hypothetical protein